MPNPYGLPDSANIKVDPVVAADQIGNVLRILRGEQIPDSGAPVQVSSTAGEVTGGNVPAQTGGTYSDDFYAKILTGIGAPVTPENLRLMHAWTQAEGMDPSRNNPFATTQGAAGSSDINGAGVKSYPDEQTGIDATIQTLLNGNYANIVSGLKSGTDAMVVANAIAASPWGTGRLVQKVLGG